MEICLVIGIIILSITLGHRIGYRMCGEDIMPYVNREDRPQVISLFKMRMD